MRYAAIATPSALSAAPRPAPSSSGATLLSAAAAAWVTAAVAGQWLFAGYVAGFYGPLALRGDFAGWNRVMPHGYVPGDLAGNLAVALHLLLAVVLLTGGAAQLLPVIRRREPALHRWNGRVYLVSAMLLGAGGLFMVWTRGTVGGLTQRVSISANAMLLLAFGVLAWRTAVARRVADHRRWALRLFLVSGGVWFFRIGLMLWLAIHRAPVGFNPETFEGPFLTFLGFGQFLLPLAVLELYFYAQRSPRRPVRTGVAVLLLVLTLATAAGTLAATFGMWLPRLR